MKLYMIMVFIVVSGSLAAQNSWKYPESRKIDISDDYFGTKVNDPYRWLENDTSAETEKWVEAQNAITFSYLDKIPFREKIKTRLTQLWDYPKISAPFIKAGMVFYFKNDGLQNQSVLYVKNKLEDKDERILLDPNKLSTDGTVSLGDFSITNDGRYMAYSISRGGSDWNEIYVRDIASGKDLPDKIEWVKFSGIAWVGNGFYYSRYDIPVDGSALSQKNEFHKVYYHTLGQKQEADKLIYEDKEHPLRNFSVGVSEDERFLLLSETESTHGNSLFLKDLKRTEMEFVKIAEGFDYEFNFIDNIGDELFIITNFKAPRYRLMSVNAKNPKLENWIEIIPERKEVLGWISLAGNKFVAGYMKDACSQVEIFSEKGKYEGKVQLPGLGTVGGFNSKRSDDVAFFSFTSFTVPGEIYKYQVSSGKSELYLRPKLDFDGSLYETRQVFYSSKDGTQIPMFITMKKGLTLNGTNPTLLYGYGGFNISLNPGFSVTRTVWLENGGVVAIVNLRGGGEYGEEWHKAGTKLQKQNVFDDFIAAAEFLIQNKYTSPSRLTIQGGSNGGLLVGAVANQRPDLFAVALPAVGVMDMLRFHKFTIGWAWTGDYGSSENKEEFEYIYRYSPLHNIRKGIEYPAIMVTTADHDDRVVPAHSFKYIARMQDNYQGKKPAFIRVDVKAGHGAGKPTAKVIQEYTDLWSFAFYNMGFVPKY